MLRIRLLKEHFVFLPLHVLRTWRNLVARPSTEHAVPVTVWSCW